MRPGWKTSEFWLAAHWLAFAGYALRQLLDTPPDAWPAALAKLPAVAVLVWIAGAHANNYGENRYRLKTQAAQRKPDPEPEQDGPTEPAQTIGFGRHVASPSDDDEGEE